MSVTEPHHDFFIDYERLHKPVRRPCARHVDADRQDSRGATLQTLHVEGRLVSGLAFAALQLVPRRRLPFHSFGRNDNRFLDAAGLGFEVVNAGVEGQA